MDDTRRNPQLMNVKALAVGPIQSNCFILSGTSRNAIVIDPGDDAPQISAFLTQTHLTPVVYLLTHGHMDHISALAELCALHPAPVAMHPDDLRWAYGEENQLPPFLPVPTRPSATERALADGQTAEDAGLEYTVIGTPGHTPGSVCFLFSKHQALFTGDTLFAGAVGRTDLNGGNSRQLTQSLRRLASLPDSLRIYPGHGPDTDLRHERLHNFFLSRLPADSQSRQNDSPK
jgi:glyoxylase-like metal-dependent hydrolase (beta-lactamase superfamily II)